MKRTLILSLFIMGVAVISACNSTPAPVVFDIELTEFAFTPNTFEAQVGQQVTINLMNTGALEHEFMVGKNAMMMDGAPSGFEHNLFEGEEPMVMGANDDHGMEGMGGMDHGFMVAVPKGSDTATTLTFTVTEDMVGEWEIGCFTDGGSHFNQGMHGTLVINP